MPQGMGRARVPTRSGPTPHLHLPGPLPGTSSHPEAPADPSPATRPLLPTPPPLRLLSAGNRERWAGPTPQQTLRVSANSRVQWEASCLHIHRSRGTEQGRDGSLLPGKQLALGAVAWKGSPAWPGATHVLKLSYLQGQDPQDPVLAERVQPRPSRLCPLLRLLLGPRRCCSF